MSPELRLESYNVLNHMTPSSIKNADLDLVEGVSSSSCDISESCLSLAYGRENKT